MCIGLRLNNEDTQDTEAHKTVKSITKCDIKYYYMWLYNIAYNYVYFNI
jgi:hypothetical protein